MHPLRTLLFAPGNHPSKVEKVFAAGADAVILDLEDAVAIAEKPATRPLVTAALRHVMGNVGSVSVSIVTAIDAAVHSASRSYMLSDSSSGC